MVGRIVAGRPRLFASMLCGLVVWVALPSVFGALTRALLAWDTGALALLLLSVLLFNGERHDRMADDAARQEEGEWTLFWFTVAMTIISFAAILGEFSAAKNATPEHRDLLIALVAATLLLSWLVTQTLFAFRYAHEYYGVLAGTDRIEGGLSFPGDEPPDYWDFVYFAFVLGMTFQVSDVEITNRKLRRLATAHGLLGFLFNTVILALTINIASSLL